MKMHIFETIAQECRGMRKLLKTDRKQSEYSEAAK
jgi:hypothetical protein